MTGELRAFGQRRQCGGGRLSPRSFASLQRLGMAAAQPWLREFAGEDSSRRRSIQASLLTEARRRCDVDFIQRR